MGTTHGWAEVGAQRKREIIAAIASGEATAGPAHVELDLTDRCNVACYFCNQQDLRTKEQLPLDTITGLLDELVASGLKSVRLSGGGDPLFHKQIVEVLDNLAARGVVIDNLTTNGMALLPEIAERLVANGCREVIFSLNAADGADYHRMMQVKPASFERVVANAQQLIERRGGGSLPFVTVQFLIDRVNHTRIADMYAVGRSIGADRIAMNLVLEVPNERVDPNLVLKPEDWGAMEGQFTEVLERDREAGVLQLFFPVAEWNEQIERIKARLGGSPAIPFTTAASFQEANNQCFFAWYSATITGNGNLYPCCMLLRPGYPALGNVKDGPFRSHWHGAAFSRLRHEMREVFLHGGKLFYRKKRFQYLAPECVKAHHCGLKSMYFRGDEEFYGELGRALEATRAREVGWLKGGRPFVRAAERLAFRIGVPLRARLGRWKRGLKRLMISGAWEPN